MIDRLMPQPNISRDRYLRLTLLIGQSLSMGATLVLLVVTANSLFLTTFGARALPYVFIVVAFAGFLLSSSMAALQRRWTLVRLAIITIAGLAIFFLLCWLGVAVLHLGLYRADRFGRNTVEGLNAATSGSSNLNPWIEMS